MLWPVKIALKLIARLWLVVLSVAAGMALAFYLQLRELHKSWGLHPADTSRSLTGDDLVPTPTVVETRSLVVDAPPSRVWPWLVQMGYGRGGWYSYDQLDMKGPSARRILPRFQELAEGDIMPTHPGGGLVARVVEPGRALVLYLDNELMRQQLEASAATQDAGLTGDRDEGVPGSLQVAGALGDMTMPRFRTSWAFILESEEGGRTRLVERFRVWTAEGALPRKLGMPLMGLGVFAMTRKHMLGVKERAEADASDGGAILEEVTA